MLLSVLHLLAFGGCVITYTLGTAISSDDEHHATRSRYSRAHSLGADYNFDARDGWTTLNVTDIQSKHERNLDSADDIADQHDHAGLSEHQWEDRKQKKKPKKPSKNIGDLLGPEVLHDGNLDSLFHAVGDAEDVIITWYTGSDLQNPSCWSDNIWTPTDDSFVAALTLEGWNHKPQCFKFLELCNGPTRCCFVRVVDTCAGCAVGSRHVDLSRGAFGTLADFDMGILNVQMRPASDPKGAWYEDLWGPKKH